MRVTALQSGQAFLDFMKDNEPDLILMDVKMPEMDGFETLARFRELNGGSFKTPVIFLTADEGEDPNYIQIWQWNAELDDRVNPGLITGNISEEDGVKYIEFYDTEYKEAWTDPDGTEHEAGNYYIADYTKWFMVHSTYGDTGAYWWGEARYARIAIPLETTGITELKNDGRQLTTSKTYNLLGQEVTPATKGLVIKDGRKVVVK